MPPPPAPAPALDPPTFATAQLSLLAADLAADTARTLPLLAAHAPKRLAAAGLALTNLVLAGRRTGIGGRTVLVLEVDGAVGGGGGGVGVGDVVRVGKQVGGGEGRKGGVEGVVVRVGSGSGGGVQVAVGEGEEGGGSWGGRLWV
ncbi:hypothetical protein HO133_002116 [Letharia lupina]|uniref:Uncharacterized protein n=1 Tax=Letharia lupina TaxID=560253 RepID=A0A8H6CDN6_9LECA|nr:uncharacterized protein HO133_002116 [Letharia lupina]KAF6221261.1 hypothetical protein HO133_002116 [Letharia lupina]